MSYPESLRSGQRQGEDWRGGYPSFGPPRSHGGLSMGMLMTGLVVVGLGLMTWKYLGPDIRRYMKINTM